MKPVLELYSRLTTNEQKTAFFTGLNKIDSSNQDALAKKLVQQGKTDAPVIIKGLAKNEIETLKLEQKGTALRSNSLSSKMLGEYQKPILEATSKEILNTTREIFRDGGLHEVNPEELSKISSDQNKNQDIEENQKEIKDKALKWLMNAASQIDTIITPELKDIYKSIYNELHTQTGDDNLATIVSTNLLFLRFFNAKLATLFATQNTEEGKKYLESMSPEEIKSAQREGMLVSKIIQNLVNQMMPGKKEAYMAFSAGMDTTSLDKIINYIKSEPGQKSN